MAKENNRKRLNKKASQKKTKFSDEIVKRILSQSTLFIDQYETPHIATRKNGTEVLKLDSEKFKLWLNSFVYREYHTTLVEQVKRTVISSLKGIATYDGAGTKRLEARIYLEDSKGTLWYDLGESAVKINKNGWTIVAYPPILFRRFQHQKKQVIPEHNGDFELLHELVNIENDDDWLLFSAFAISILIPGSPRPALILNGSHGAGKSTPMRLLLELIDPSSQKSSGMPKSYEDLIRVASMRALLFFDNLSKMPTDVSDNLCRLITGDGFAKRRLYTDEDEIIYNLCRPIMFNGINQVVTQADLLDRSIPITIERIPEEKRVAETDLMSRFESMKPAILGGMFDAVSFAMRLYPDIELGRLPRMADFAKWGYAITIALGRDGEDFLKAYDKIIDRQAEEAVEASPVANAVKFLLLEKDSWEGTAAQFFDKFEHESDVEAEFLNRDPFWPKSPSAVSRAIHRAETSLKTLGIEVEHYRQHGKKYIRFSRQPDNNEILDGESALSANTEDSQVADESKVEIQSTLPFARTKNQEEALDDQYDEEKAEALALAIEKDSEAFFQSIEEADIEISDIPF